MAVAVTFGTTLHKSGSMDVHFSTSVLGTTGEIRHERVQIQINQNNHGSANVSELRCTDHARWSPP